MVISKLTPEYGLYASKQSQQIGGQTGEILCQHIKMIGSERTNEADMYRSNLANAEFREDFAKVLSSLSREEGVNILRSEADCKDYFSEHPDGIKIETNAYTYLIKGNEQASNIDIYAYVAGYLDCHIEEARRGIRFIDSGYNEKFRIPDGGRIRIDFNDGSLPEEQVCRYIDDYHFQTENGGIYHICQYAEMCEGNGYSVEPVSSKEKMTVIVVEPRKEPYLAEIGTDLEDLQRAVNGYIEAVYPFDDEVAIICSEEGKIMGLPLNRALYDDEGKMYDIIAGKFLVVGLTEDDFDSISREMADKYIARFKTPEQFYRLGSEIVATPIKAKTQTI